MKIIKISSVLVLSIGLFACGGGSGGSSSSGGGGGNVYPTGTCISNNPTFTPTIFTTPSKQTFLYAYAGAGVDLTLQYEETESVPSYSFFSANFANASATLPNGVCAMGTVKETGAITNLNDTVVYYTNCNATTNNLQMQFTANYGVYYSTQTPSTATPIQSGTLSASCMLNPV